MALTYEQSIAELQKLPNGSEIIESLTEKVHAVNNEAAGLRQRYKATEGSLAKLKEALKASELDPDSDIPSQLNDRINKLKEGTKPASEYDGLAKDLLKVKKDLESWKSTAEKNAQEAEIAKARAAFSGKLTDHFGKASDVLLDYAVRLGQIVVKDGVPGVLVNDDFTPLNVESGTNAIDVLRKLYPQFAITKQVPGSKNSNTRAPMGNEKSEKEMSRTDFTKLSSNDPRAAMAFVKSGGTLTDE